MKIMSEIYYRGELVMVRLPFITNRYIQMLQGWVAGVSEDIAMRKTSIE